MQRWHLVQDYLIPDYSDYSLAETTVTNIILKVNRLGNIIPLIILKPVQLNGRTFSMALLNSESELASKDIRVGDYVTVKMSRIILIIERVHFDKRDKGISPYIFPDTCPACDHELQKQNGEANRKCLNNLCPGKIEGLLLYFSGRKVLNIERLDDRLAAKLLKFNLVKKPSDIFRLTHEQLESLPKMNQRTVNSMLKSIDDARRADLWKFICGLSIPHIGEVKAKLLAELFLSMRALADTFQRELPNRSTFELTPKNIDLYSKMALIGPKTVQTIQNFFRNPDSQDFINDLLDPELVQPKPPKPLKRHPLSGLHFFFAGKLVTHTRSQAKDEILSLGGKFDKVLSQRSHFVIAGRNPGFQLEEARKKNIRIIDENQFSDIMMITAL
jgi:DNA ligase (NAD+)